MYQAIVDKLDLFSEEMQFHYVAPNTTLIAEVLRLDADRLSALMPFEVSKYVFVLGQYLVLLQHNENIAIIHHRLAQKTFEYTLNKFKLESKDIIGKTAKERDAWVLINVDAVRKLHDELLELEAKKLLMDGMVRAVEGLLNALKKEMSGRYTD